MKKEAGSFDKHKMTGYGKPVEPFMVSSIASLNVTSYILLLASCFLLLCFFTPVFHAQSSFNGFLYQEASLTDWGLTDPSQIGYVSVGVLHKEEGKKLFIYDIRRQSPVVKEPKGPRGRAPSFEGNLFMVSHFDQGNTNGLGGYFSGFSKSPSQAALAIGKAPDGTPALVFSYRLITPGFAGFWIHLFNFKKHPAVRIFLDTTPFAYLTFSISGERGGEELLLLQVADRRWEKKGDSLVVGDVASFLPAGRINNKWQQAWIPLTKLPEGLNQKELASLVFVVKQSGSGRVFVKDLAFTTKMGVQIPRSKEAKTLVRHINKAMWLWETEKIVTNSEEQQKLITFCETQSITDLFLQIPYEAKKEKGKWEILWDSSKVRPLIADLHRAGVKVHALDGDPRFALKKLHGRVIALIQSIIQYNREVTPQERFDGIRYDNEPYLLPNFAGVHKEAVLKQYLSLLKASQSLAKQANLTFGVDIPFWFDDQDKFFEQIAAVEGRPVSELIIDIVDNIGIMDYRTQAYGADGVIAHAHSELQYAAKRGKKVFVGLETFELPDETILEFGSRGSGSQILIKRLDSKRIRLYWIPDGNWERFKRDPQFSQDVVVLAQTHVTHVPATKLTFAQKDLKDLETVMQQTKSELQKFSSFYGFAIHSYESYRAWLERQKGGNMKIKQLHSWWRLKAIFDAVKEEEVLERGYVKW